MENNLPSQSQPVAQTPTQNAVPLQQTPPPAPDQTTAQSTPPPTSVPPKKRGMPLVLKILLILFIIFIVLLAAGAGLFYYLAQKNPILKNFTNVQNVKETLKDVSSKKSYPGTVIIRTPQSSTGSSSASSQTDQAVTSDPSTSREETWNTYLNKGYKFSVDFPSDLQETETSPGFGVTNIKFQDKEDPQEGFVFQILVYPNSFSKLMGLDFEEIYAMKDNTSKNIETPDNESVILTKLRSRTIGSLKAFDFSSNTNPPDPNIEPEAGIYIQADTNIIIISGGESDKDTLEQMLQTFKYPI